MSDEKWRDIQTFYDNGGTYKTINKKYGLSMSTISKAVKEGNLKTRSKSEANKLSRKNNPSSYIMSDETKKKISVSRTKYLKENPDKVPYLLNHYTNGESYPETYFSNVFEKEFIKVDRYIQEGIYQIDFAIIDKSIAIEVDGEQHYLDKNIVESDKRKNKYLKEKGWDLIRIRWSHYQKLNKEEKKEYVDNLINYIETSENKPIIEEMKNICECGVTILKKSKRCLKCESNRRSEENMKNIPSYKILMDGLKESNYTSLGRKYNVSDNTIRRWIKKYE